MEFALILFWFSCVSAVETPRPRETVAQGIESAPEAFMGLLRGRNFGKQLVKLI